MINNIRNLSRNDKTCRIENIELKNVKTHNNQVISIRLSRQANETVNGAILNIEGSQNQK